MGLKLRPTGPFKRDLKQLHKRGKDLKILQNLIDSIKDHHPLPEKYKNHKLTGNFSGYWECHIQPDWLLVYKKDKENLYLSRTGTHSDLF